MSALCAYPSLMASGGFTGLAHSSSVAGLGGSYAIPTAVDSHSSRHHGYSINARSQFTAYTAYAATPANNLPGSKSEKLMADTQSGGLWTQEPAAKRRCTDKSRASGGWSTDVGSTAAIWSQQQQSSRSSTSSLCPSGCAMCHQQQQQQHNHQQQLQQQQQQHYQSQMESANRRPLQERHQNRLMADDSLLAAASAAAGSGNVATPAPPMKPAAMVPSPMLLSRSSRSAASSQGGRQLCVDPKKDYSSPLHVDCSVEYDLPRVVRPPPGAQPLLMLAPRRQQPSSSTPSSSSHHASHGNHVGRSDVLYHPQQQPRHPSTLMPANNQAVWNATNAALATALAGDWTTPKQPKLINKSTATGGNSSNIIKNGSADAARPMVAAPAPHLMGGNVGGAMLQRNTAVAAGQCGCPSCIGRHSAFGVTPSAAAAAVRVQSAWSHWSPPIGATAAAVYQQQQQQQHQRAVASFQLPGVTYVDQQPQQVNPRRRKRTDESADKSSMSGLYATSAAWMNAQTAAAAAAADAAFAAANRFAAAAPWMTNPAPHLKFPC